jgi:hypothetical protein
MMLSVPSVPTPLPAGGTRLSAQRMWYAITRVGVGLVAAQSQAANNFPTLIQLHADAKGNDPAGNGPLP